MLIGVDGNEANVEKKVGVSEFAYRLILEFYARHDLEFEIYLKQEPRDDMPKARKGWAYKVVGPKPLWTQFALPKALLLMKKKPDVFFTPTHYGPRFSPCPTVVSIMDLAFMHFPQLFKKRDLYQLKSWTGYSVKKASKVITISKSAKDDIINEYNLPSSKVEVVYPGIKDQNTKNRQISMDELEKKYKVKGKYILFVGTLQPRKNIVKLVEAFKQVSEKNKEIQLVIIGRKGWLFEEILESPKKFGVQDKVLFLDNVTDEDLPSFYRNAQCFVLPSLYEGFGLPIVEAMQYGCPVITSNISSLPEAGGDAALYFDPNNVGEIARRISEVINDKLLRDKMVKEGYEQIKKFSWEKSAREVLSVLEEVAGKN